MAPSYSHLPLPATLASLCPPAAGHGALLAMPPSTGTVMASVQPPAYSAACGIPSPPPASGEEKPTRMQKPRL